MRRTPILPRGCRGRQRFRGIAFLLPDAAMAADDAQRRLEGCACPTLARHTQGLVLLFIPPAH